MMGGTPGTGPGSGAFGGPMMGSAPNGYHLSRLTCSPPSSLPGPIVYVRVGDMAMPSMMGGATPLGGHMMFQSVPAQVPAGQISFVVGNMGWRIHELVVLPLAAGQSAGERIAGAGEGIKSGTNGWVTLNLPAGRYELVCNLRNHYANGMHQLLVVT